MKKKESLHMPCNRAGRYYLNIASFIYWGFCASLRQMVQNSGINITKK